MPSALGAAVVVAKGDGVQTAMVNSGSLPVEYGRKGEKGEVQKMPVLERDKGTGSYGGVHDNGCRTSTGEVSLRVTIVNLSGRT